MNDRLVMQVRESFFNPILHISPVLLFIVLGYFINVTFAWIMSLVVSAGLIIYVGKAYKGLFKWYLLYVGVSIFIMFLMSLSHYFLKNTWLHRSSYELAFLIGVSLVSVLKKPTIRLSERLVSPLHPMTNNITELYKVVNIFIYLAAGYIFLFAIFKVVNNQHTYRFLTILNFTYVMLVILIIIYEFVRVRVIRKHLLKEKWLPILNYEGRPVGSAQQFSSFLSEKKYIHPLIRGVYISENKLLMQVPVANEIIPSPLWDSFLSNHISVNETAQKCLEKTALDFYNLKELKAFYLTKYMLETPFEYQYTLVFIICKTESNIVPDSKYIQQIKWWTSQQIENNLNKGIFTEQFLKEFDLLKRSGLIESEEYNCDCDDF